MLESLLNNKYVVISAVLLVCLVLPVLFFSILQRRHNHETAQAAKSVPGRYSDRFRQRERNTYPRENNDMDVLSAAVTTAAVVAVALSSGSNDCETQSDPEPIDICDGDDL